MTVKKSKQGEYAGIELRYGEDKESKTRQGEYTGNKVRNAGVTRYQISCSKVKTHDMVVNVLYMVG